MGLINMTLWIYYPDNSQWDVRQNNELSHSVKPNKISRKLMWNCQTKNQEYSPCDMQQNK